MMKINSNYAWAKIFVQRLEFLGIKDVCVSPGSRNTPLTIAFSESKKIASYIFVDERSSAFFALGIAKKTKIPTVIITTSGTATAELYPAIIEAFQTRTPLLICTADRPKILRFSGANQTINQENIYKNHISHFIDFGLPNLSKENLKQFVVEIDKAFSISSFIEKRPVHINFPFEKPLEPEELNSEIDENLFGKLINKKIISSNVKRENLSLKTLKLIEKSNKILFSAGIMNENDERTILSFVEKNSIPIISDGLSGIRFTNSKANFTFGSILTNKLLTDNFSPDLIIHFGKTPTSAKMEKFFSQSKANKLQIDAFGDKHDGTLTFQNPIKIGISDFLEKISSKLNLNSNKEYFSKFQKIERNLVEIEKKMFTSDFSIEPNVIKQIVAKLPEKCNIFIGNSTIPRDIDFFTRRNFKNFAIFSNRGASGIDGIISTSAGIAVKSKKPTFLLIGDLSFFYDLTFLHYLKLKRISLKIILINNNGGGIFNLLPISNHKKGFVEYFRTPINLDFEPIIKSFGGKYQKIQTQTDFDQINFNEKGNSFEVFEFQTNSELSKEIRIQLFKEYENEF